MPTKKNTTPDTVITLTLPHSVSISKSGTLLIQREDLAKLCEFHYTNAGDITSAIRDAMQLLDDLEQNPPVIPETKLEVAKSELPPKDEEPTIDVPLKKGHKAVKMSYIKIIGGESDAMAYRQAVMIAGKLIDGKLWDGETPIRFDDVYAIAKKMKHLTVKDLSLFELSDFVKSEGVD